MANSAPFSSSSCTPNSKLQANKGAPRLNIGHSSRLGYDCCAYEDKLSESVSPLGYRLDTNARYNCGQCLSTLGPRSSLMGQGASTDKGFPVATSQALVDTESILKNINLKMTKCKRDEVNPINVTEYKLEHLNSCNDFLNPLSSRLSYPAANYRSMSINRFYDLNHNPQLPIFWNFATNTTLEAKDNFTVDLPRPIIDNSLPTELKGTTPICTSVSCSK